MKKIIGTLSASAVLLLASGCSHMDPNLGKRIDQNTTAQTVDPSAEVLDKKVDATLDGQKAEQLLKRYRSEKAELATERLLKDISN